MQNDYYVYAQRRADNGVVFYIGKGRQDRYKRNKLSKKWKEVVLLAGGFVGEKLQENLTEQEALSLETHLISTPNHDWVLVNSVKSFNVAPLDYETINDYVYYDETSPTCLRWKKWNRSKIKKTAKFAGDIAGYLLSEHSGKVYYAFRCNSRTILVHRAVWILFNQEIPNGFIVNHKDANGCNNNVDNLTCITQAVNSRQTSKQHALSGVRRMTVGAHTYTVAQWIDLDGKKQTKLFSHVKLGSEESDKLALKFRQHKIKELNAAGAGYGTRGD